MLFLEIYNVVIVTFFNICSKLSHKAKFYQQCALFDIFYNFNQYLHVSLGKICYCKVYGLLFGSIIFLILRSIILRT